MIRRRENIKIKITVRASPGSTTLEAGVGREWALSTKKTARKVVCYLHLLLKAQDNACRQSEEVQYYVVDEPDDNFCHGESNHTAFGQDERRHSPRPG